VVDGISQDFWGHPRAGAMKFMAARDSMVRKNFTATNLGGTGTPYGLVPFDLLAPSRLNLDGPPAERSAGELRTARGTPPNQR